MLLVSSLVIGIVTGSQAPAAAANGTVDIRSTSANDSVEERTNDGYMYRTSSDFEFFYDGAISQSIGIRFPGVSIPDGATITSSWIEFTADGSSSGNSQMLIQGEASASPAPYGADAYNLSSRPKTTQLVQWSTDNWSAGNKYKTQSLNHVVQAITDGPWQDGNAMAFIIRGTGSLHRAFTYKDGSGNAPRLQIEYTTGPGDNSQTIEVRVNSGADDVEERLSNNAVSSSSTDLELTHDRSRDQLVGIRFESIGVPTDATITAAWIEFEVDEASYGSASLEIWAERTGNAPEFTTAASNVSSRTKSLNSTPWTPSVWASVNAKHKTPSLRPIVQELASRADWAPGNSMAFLIGGTGRRAAESYNGEPGAAPLLHIEYTTTAVPDPQTSPLVINEIFQQGLPGGHWVEIHNTSNQPASLLDHEICTNVDCHQISTNLTVPAGGQRVVQASDISFTATGWVRLSDVSAGAAAGPLDEYSWTALAPISYGRCPDGTGAMQITSTVTMQAANDCAAVVSQSLNVRVSNGADDVEQRLSNGNVTNASTDVELIRDGSNDQLVGIRFQGVNVPPGATITNAWLEFEVDEVSTGTSSLSIQAQRSGNAESFATTTNNVSSRTRTTAAVNWSPPNWGQVNAKHQSPSLASVVQEVVSLANWGSGNSMAFIISGSGRRAAESYNGEPGAAPLLHIEYASNGALQLGAGVHFPVVVNEVFMQGQASNHWVEFYNTSDAAVDLNGYEVCTSVDCNLIGSSTIVQSGARYVMQDGDIYFGSSDRVRIYAPQALGRPLVDEFTWNQSASSSYGRCPDGVGELVLTAAATSGSANNCGSVIPPSGAWPGSGTTVSFAQPTGDNWSGLDYEASGADTGSLWAVRNGPSRLTKIARTAAGWGGASTYTVPGNLDTEAVTTEQSGDNLVYLGVERDNDDGGSADNMIVQFNTANGQARQWGLTELNTVGANAGIEGLTWIPDTDLGSLSGYNPADHANHRSGVFVVGMETGSLLRFYVLNHDAGSDYTKVYEVDSGLNKVMGLEYDASTGLLFATCDNNCPTNQRVTALSLNTQNGQFEVQGTYGAPSGHNGYNNEGFALLPTATCSAGNRPALWADDNGNPGIREVNTTIGC